MRISEWSSDVYSSDLDPLFVETRASARVTPAELAHEQAQARSGADRDLLASYWGGDGQGLEIAGGIERPTGVPSALAGADADVREAAIARARAEVVLEQSRATQDYTVGGGLRFMRETNDVALVAGISIPPGRCAHNNVKQEQTTHA